MSMQYKDRLTKTHQIVTVFGIPITVAICIGGLTWIMNTLWTLSTVVSSQQEHFISIEGHLSLAITGLQQHELELAHAIERLDDKVERRTVQIPQAK